MPRFAFPHQAFWGRLLTPSPLTPTLSRWERVQGIGITACLRESSLSPRKMGRLRETGMPPQGLDQRDEVADRHHAFPAPLEILEQCLVRL